MPNFVWDARVRGGAGGYRDTSTGRLLSNAGVRSILDAAIDSSQTTTRTLSLQLRDGTISLRDWQLSMRQMIKSTHINAAIAQRGGLAQMTQADWGRVGQIIRTQYQYLDKFAAEIANGTQALDGRFLVRSQMYDEASIQTFDRFQRNAMRNAGYNEERNILEPGVNHCLGCLDESARGWVAIGTLKPLGTRTCLSRDRCTIEYRNTETGEEIE